MKSLLLFSGGMDSSALLFWKRPSHALLINYGQLIFSAELKAATEIAKSINIAFSVITVDCTMLGSGTLAGNEFSKFNEFSEWWPFRNQLLLTFASMYAVKHQYSTILIGLTKSDRLYRDSSSEFISLMNSVTMFQEGNIQLISPATSLETIDLIKISGIPNSVLAWSHSCNTSIYPCGTCFSCKKHNQIITELNF